MGNNKFIYALKILALLMTPVVAVSACTTLLFL